MAPLNEEDEEDEDSTVFDIKYRYGWGGQLLLGSGAWGAGAVHLGKPHEARCGFLTFGHVFDLGGKCSDFFPEHTTPKNPAGKSLQRNG